MTIVRVASGGIPVVESATGLPYEEATNGFGIPVTFGLTGTPLGTVAWWLRTIRADSSTVTVDTTMVTADNSK